MLLAKQNNIFLFPIIIIAASLVTGIVFFCRQVLDRMSLRGNLVAPLMDFVRAQHHLV